MTADLVRRLYHAPNLMIINPGWSARMTLMPHNAVHVYGGRFFTAHRSEWETEGLIEQTYDVEWNRRLFEVAYRRSGEGSLRRPICGATGTTMHAQAWRSWCRHYPIELQFAFRHFGYDMALVAHLNANPPTLATWERKRFDMEAAYIVIVTNHGVAVRGNWLCDSWTRGVPVKIKDAPHRCKRVQFVCVVTGRGAGVNL